MRNISLPATLLLISAGCSNSRIEVEPENVVEDDVIDVYVHSNLGELYREDVDWRIDEVAVAYCEDRIEVCLANGSQEGPSQAALSGYAWIESHWPVVHGLIQEQAFAFYEPYASAFASVPRIAAPDKIWGTELLVSVCVYSKDQFTVTMQFTWQEDDDPHQVTFYVEDGRCETHSVDG